MEVKTILLSFMHACSVTFNSKYISPVVQERSLTFNFSLFDFCLNYTES